MPRYDTDEIVAVLEAFIDFDTARLTELLGERAVSRLDRYSYQQLWLELYPPNGDRIKQADSVPDDGYSHIEMQYPDNGVYDGVADVDFETFSFTLLKYYAEKQRYDNVVNAVQAIEHIERSYRRKKLRIQLFEVLQSNDCGLYCPALYGKVRNKMKEAMVKLDGIVADECDTGVLLRSWDSVMFQAPKDEAQQVTERINNEFELLSVSMTYIDRYVKFYNVLGYRFNGDNHTGLKATTRYSETYYNVKKDVVQCLLAGQFDMAKRAIADVDDSEITQSKLKDYMAAVTEIEHGIRGTGQNRLTDHTDTDES